uniref:alpha/beta fold hydrolase n=1 Tax=Bradyrhizobium sp. Ec3.3 TaxID=189753 RepID=UPI001FD8AD97
ISIEREIDIVEAVIQRTNSAVHLVGHSWGATVCLATVLRDRTKVASLTLIEATPVQSASPLRRSRAVRASARDGRRLCPRL